MSLDDELEEADEIVTLTVDAAAVGLRLDQYLAQQFPTFSRVHLRRVINAGAVRIGQDLEKGAKPSHRLKAGEQLTIKLIRPERETHSAEEIPLTILYEDDCLIVVNKPPGMVVHPARGHWSGTLTAALQFHFDTLSGVGGPSRPGIVHRLDRDTSGVILVAKDDPTHYRLAAQFQNRTLEKEYLAIATGRIDRDRDSIDVPIGPHPHDRVRMAVRRDHPDSKTAESFYEVTERLGDYSVVKVLPKTGRTHQIRVHLAHIGHPVLCDKLYSGRSRITEGELAGGAESGPVVLERQALHARRLVIEHPTTRKAMEFVAPIPEDMRQTMDALRAAGN